MYFAVVNVRPSRQFNFDIVRIDNRNKDLAISAIGHTVLLYAPRDEPLHGYFGKAELADVRLDASHRRFMFLELDNFEKFANRILPEHAAEPVESLAYRTDGSKDFSYFSTGIRLLSEDDRSAISRLEPGMQRPSGLEDTASAQPELARSPTYSRRRTDREVVMRDARLRWAVLETYGASCAICGCQFADEQRGNYEVEVCHLQAVRYGGPDTIGNALPMCRTHHWAYDAGLFTLLETGQILVSNRMAPDLRSRFNGRSRATFPQTQSIRPGGQYLRFHRDAVFQR